MKFLYMCSAGFVLVVSLLLGLFNYFKIPMELEPQNLEGKSYLVTGCTPGGIGFETAKQLLEWHASLVICTMRSSKVDVLPETDRFKIVALNLDSLQSVRSSVDKIRERFPSTLLHGLVLNAGSISVNFTLTEDGFESTFQVNHLSQFYLFQLLQQSKMLENDGRVVFVSSGLHRLGARSSAYETKPSVADDDTYDCWKAYGQSKYFNVLAARALSRRNPTLHIFSVSPGMVKTNIEGKIETAPDAFMNSLMMSLLGRSVKNGAVRTLQALTSSRFNAVTGLHVDEYVPLPTYAQVTLENEEWLLGLSNRFLNMGK